MFTKITLKFHIYVFIDNFIMYENNSTLKLYNII